MRAKIMTCDQQDALIAHLSSSRHGTRNAVLGLLSCKAGLRACEMAGLDWAMVLDATGRIGSLLEITGTIAKYGSARSIPVHPQLRSALRRLHAEQRRPVVGPVCRSQRGRQMTAKSIVNLFTGTYRELGYRGCSSHSGRRTLITLAARQLHRAGASLKDIQLMVGHRNLATTSAYIEGDSLAQKRLIGLL